MIQLDNITTSLLTALGLIRVNVLFTNFYIFPETYAFNRVNFSNTYIYLYIYIYITVPL